MQHPPRRIVQLVQILLLMACANAAVAQSVWPTRPVRWIVPYPAGGSTDIIARHVATRVGSLLGQNIVVENRGGAGGTIGAMAVKQSAADGYTFLVGAPADQVNAPILSKVNYDPAQDFVAVGCMMRGANVLVANPQLPATDVKSLLALARAQPGRLNYGSAGNGNTSHLSGELLKHLTGVFLVHIPYRGNGPAITDTIGGQVQMMFSNPISVQQHIRSGALRAIAVTASTRLAALPEVPTFKEAGLPLEVYAWMCLMAPTGTPDAVTARMAVALTSALQDGEVIRALEASGSEVFRATPQEAAAFITAERTKWGELIRSRKITAD
jgi:tripartite-type tricarboxylate transporter receptor subunit TctC